MFIATGIPWNLFSPFTARTCELTIPEAERTTRILNDGNGFRSDRLKRCVYGEKDVCMQNAHTTNNDDSRENGAGLDNPSGKCSKDCYLSSQNNDTLTLNVRVQLQRAAILEEFNSFHINETWRCDPV